MHDQNDDLGDLDQVVYTALASNHNQRLSDYLAGSFPWPFKGHWLSDCCLIQFDNDLVGRMTYLFGKTQGSRDSTEMMSGRECAGIQIEVINRMQGNVITQSFPFMDYVEGYAENGNAQPRLIQPTKGQIGWYIDRHVVKRPSLKAYGTAIQVFVQIMSGVQLGTSIIKRGHQPLLAEDEFVIEGV